MRRYRVLVVSAIMLIALSACGGPAENGKEEPASEARVATLTTPSAEPSASKAERPRLRLDTTTEEFVAMLGPYKNCLKEQGVEPPEGESDRPPSVETPEGLEKFEAAKRICEPQFYPLPPWEKDPANPESRDFALAVVQCLKDKGVKYVEVAEDGTSLALGGDQNHSQSISLGLEFAGECEREVAAKMK